MRAAARFVCTLLLWAVALPAVAAPAIPAGPTFPALTSHVVDDAGILSAGTRTSLDQALTDYERSTGNQVVVATLRSLQGYSIDDYGVALGRKWGIGQKGKDNGALLIVAPHEKKVRIEVGYSLEGTLTDARSSEIINGVILPAFRTGNMEKGVADGTRAILDVLGGKAVAGSAQSGHASPAQVIFIVLFFFWIIWISRRHPFIAAWMMSNALRSGTSGIGSSWGGSGGGFSGGGGSFGGGGASGGW